MELSEKFKGYANSINENWRKSTDSVIGTARLCADADKKLKTVEKTKLLGVLVFNKATFSKLAKIGAQSLLLSQEVNPFCRPAIQFSMKSPSFPRKNSNTRSKRT